DRAFNQWYIDHRPRGLLLRLADAWRDFVGLAITPADFTFTITDDDHGGEAESTAALDHRRTAFDLHDAVEQIARHAVFVLIFSVSRLTPALLSGTHSDYP